MPGPALRELNGLDRDAFVARLGAIYEHSPWVAAGAWDARPFASLDALAGAMQAAAVGAPLEARLALIRAHPELRGRVADPAALTEASRGEQAAAGLDRCTAAQFARLRALNDAYRDRFGFPFIVAVRGLDVDGILARMEARLGNAPEDEMGTCLAEIGRIARFRLEALVTSWPASR